MPRYIWQENDVIPELDVKENLQYRYAILRPKEGLEASQLQQLPEQLQRHGLVATPETENGKPVLRVRNFRKASDLSALLQQNSFISGTASRKEALPEELHLEVKSFRQYLREHSIQLAGAVYLIADAMPIISGIMRKTPADVLSGSLFATTSVGLLLFGRKNPEVQMGNIYGKLKEFVTQEGIEIGEEQALALEQLKTNPTYINGLINFLYEHPVLFNNTIQGYGCYQGYRAGVAQKNPYRAVAGLSGAFGQWSGLIIPEDKYAGLDEKTKSDKLRQRAKGEEKENGFNTEFLDNPLKWIHEKPLRLTGIGAITQNFLVAASVMFHDRHAVNEYFGYESKRFEWNPARIFKDISRGTNELLAKAGVSRAEYDADLALAGKPWLRQHTTLEHEINRQRGQRFTAASPVFNIIANTLYGMSSKEERSVNLDKAGYVDELLGVAANLYIHVPEAQRGEKIIRFAGFLRSQPDINISEKKIRERLQNKIDALEKSGWVAKVANENTTAAASQSV